MVQFKFTLTWILAFVVSIAVNFVLYFFTSIPRTIIMVTTVSIMVFLVCTCCPVFIIDIALATRRKGKPYQPQIPVSNTEAVELRRKQLELEKERLALEREKLRLQSSQGGLGGIPASEMVNICPYCGEGIEPNAKFCKYCGSDLN